MGTVIGARKPSQAAYYVALAGVVTLLLMLCCYFLYFCIKKIKELSSHPSLFEAPTSRVPTTNKTTYPVRPVVRDSATTMAKLCSQLPTQKESSSSKTDTVHMTKGDTVFPTSTSPEAQKLNTESREQIEIDESNKIETVNVKKQDDKVSCEMLNAKKQNNESSDTNVVIDAESVDTR